MTYEEAVRKATLLLRKAQGNNNVAEAALFAAKAQEIMDRFQISNLSAEIEPGKTLEPEEPIQNFGNEPALTACQKDKNWTTRLCQDVARANRCKTWRYSAAGGAQVFLVGKASDVQTARYMIGVLAEEVRRLGRECCKGYSEKYRRDFRYGVVEAIAVKLDEQWNKTKEAVRADCGNPMALVRVNNALVKMEQTLSAVDKFMKEEMDLDWKSRGSSYHPKMDARRHGYIEGSKIQINRAKGGIGAGVRGEIDN